MRKEKMYKVTFYEDDEKTWKLIYYVHAISKKNALKNAVDNADKDGVLFLTEGAPYTIDLADKEQEGLYMWRYSKKQDLKGLKEWIKNHEKERI